MATFSMDKAIGSGFRLIRREPKAVLIWIGAYLAFMVVTYGLMFAAMPDLMGVYQEMGRSALEGAEPDPSETLALVGRIWAVMPFIMLLALVWYSVMLGGIYRAVLHPEDRRLAYLRFGRQELWLLLTMLAWSLLILAIYIALVMVVVVVGIVLGVALAGSSAGGAEGNPAAVVGLGLLGMLAVGVAMLWIMLRLSMAFPMSHDRARFVLFESWRLTRGQSLRLLGVGIVLVLITIMIEVVMLIAIVVASLAAAGAGGLQALAADPDAMTGQMWWWAPLYAVLASVFGVLLFVILGTPVADIYRQLTAADEVRATV